MKKLFLVLAIVIVLGGAAIYSLSESRVVAKVVLTQWKKVPYDADSLVEAVRSENDEIIRLFFQAGFDLNQPNKKKETALGVAVGERKSSVVALLDHGAKFNVLSRGQPPLSIVVGDRDWMEFLLSEGADPNVPDEFGETALFKALQDDARLGRVELLLKAKADVNTPSVVSGRTPLTAAVLDRSVEIVDAILAAGARIDDVDKTGVTALEEAFFTGDEQVVGSLLKHKASTRGKTGLLVAAISSRKLSLVRVATELGLDLNQRVEIAWKEQGTPADLAGRLQEPEIFSFLVSRGAKPEHTYAYSRLRGAAVSLTPHFDEPKPLKGRINKALAPDAVNRHLPEVFRASVKAVYNMGPPMKVFGATISNFKEAAAVDTQGIEIETFSWPRRAGTIWLEVPEKPEVQKILARIADFSDTLISNYLQEEFRGYALKASELIASKSSKLGAREGGLILAELALTPDLLAKSSLLKSLTSLVYCSVSPKLAITPSDWSKEMSEIWIPAAGAASVRPDEESKRHCMDPQALAPNTLILRQCLCPDSARQGLNKEAARMLDEKIAAVMKANPGLFAKAKTGTRNLKTGGTGRRAPPKRRR